jgi:hypothetical protein
VLGFARLICFDLVGNCLLRAARIGFDRVWLCWFGIVAIVWAVCVCINYEFVWNYSPGWNYW